jgi:hypothetical protein
MSFLNQLKNQAQALQSQKEGQHQDLDLHARQCDLACVTIQRYLKDLAQQLDVIQPPGPRFSLDGKAFWPAMKLVDFRSDARKTTLRDKEVFQHVAMGWRIVAAAGGQWPGVVKVNFPPDLERVSTRLDQGQIKHERKEIRHPEKNSLLAIEFSYVAEARGSVIAEPDHDRGLIHFRLANISGFEILKTSYAAQDVQQALLDELAKLIVGQPSRFV